MANGDGDPRYRLRRKAVAPEVWTVERIAALRAKLGLTQAAFANEIGVRQQTVSEWETGRYLPRGSSAKLLGMLAESSDGDAIAARPPA